MSSYGRGAPFTVIDSNDQGGLLWITAGLSLSYFMLSSVSRVFISYRSFQRDTVMLYVVSRDCESSDLGTAIYGFGVELTLNYCLQAFGLAQVIAVFAQLSSGFGKSIDLPDSCQLQGIQKVYYSFFSERDAKFCMLI
jgi:hypothetical protein